MPLVLNEAGERLSKRDGAVTLRELLGGGARVSDIVGEMAASLGYSGCASVQELLEKFEPSSVTTEPYVWAHE